MQKADCGHAYACNSSAGGSKREKQRDHWDLQAGGPDLDLIRDLSQGNEMESYKAEHLTSSSGHHTGT